jgi:tetratricopeptide (TPR) repeat protein
MFKPARHLLAIALSGLITVNAFAKVAALAPTPQPNSMEKVIEKYKPQFESLQAPAAGDEDTYNPLVFDYICDVLKVKGTLSQEDFDRFGIEAESGEASFYADLRFYGADGRAGESLLAQEKNGGVVVTYSHHSWNLEKQDMDVHAIRQKAFPHAKIVSPKPDKAQGSSAFKAYVSEGKKRLYQGQFSQALESYEKARHLNPDDPKIYNYIGYAQILSGQPSEAVSSLQTSIQKDPSYALAHYNLSIAYWALNRQKESVRELDKAEKLDPGLAKAAPRDEHTKPILDSYENKIYQDLKKGVYHYVIPFRVGPPAGFEWGKTARDVSVYGMIVYENFEMFDDKNNFLAYSTDACWVLGVTGYYLTQNSDFDPVHKVSIGLAASAMVVNFVYPPISMVDGYLSRNNPKGDRGLIGTGLSALAITTMVLFNGNSSWSTGPVYPETYKGGMGLKFAMRF